jgi:hypothetical protein
MIDDAPWDKHLKAIDVGVPEMLIRPTEQER